MHYRRPHFHLGSAVSWTHALMRTKVKRISSPLSVLLDTCEITKSEPSLSRLCLRCRRTLSLLSHAARCPTACEPGRYAGDASHRRFNSLQCRKLRECRYYHAKSTFRSGARHHRRREISVETRAFGHHPRLQKNSCERNKSHRFVWYI